MPPSEPLWPGSWAGSPRAVLQALAAMALACLGGLPARAADLCTTGRHQSPIDIRHAQPSALPALRPLYAAAPLHAAHDGHTVRLRVPAGSTLMQGREALALQQMHFHLPGGDRIDGEDFPMAMHFVHKAPSGQLVTLVVPFRLGAPHPALARVLPWLPHAGQADVRQPDVVLRPADWLPPQLRYFAYTGSLTASPCTEGVRWLVLRTPQTLSADQRDALGQLFPPNARPVQPVHDRVIQAGG